MSSPIARRCAIALLAALACVLASHADAGDGIVDILWRNSLTGDVAVWFMDGASVALKLLVANVPVAANWQIVGVGDFDGNGTTDVLWQNASTGDIAVWFMDGTTIVGSVLIGNVPVSSSWAFSGVGDFDGDGDDDILWFDPATTNVGMWLMDGATVVAADIVASAIGSNWNIRGVGDFDGDGDDDIILRNFVSGDVAVWLTNGLTITQAGVVVPNVTLNWSIQAVGDLDKDGIDDVLWRNSSAGLVAVWLMNGMALPNSAVVATGVVSNWGIHALGDVDGDGDADVIWRHNLGGSVAVWIMEGQTLVAGVVVADVPILQNWIIRQAGDFGSPQEF